MSTIIRIGTRDSELALWQAETVKHQLEYLGYTTEIIPIKSTGDLVLDKPLYELGITGIFTKNLDIALLNDEIDIAVHSLKDVPTALPKGIVQAAVLKRGNNNDLLVYNNNEEFLAQRDAIIATGSLRRKAQWLHRYPTHHVVDLRGNVNTRLEKLVSNDWNGAIFAAAGLERIKKKPENSVHLNWMVPAPGQGAIMIATLAENEYAREASEKLNDEDSEICTTIEREFLRLLEGGCTAPIGALAYIKEIEDGPNEVHFKGNLLSKDGTKKIETSKKTKFKDWRTIARYCAGDIIERGGKRLMVEDAKALEKEIQVFSTKKLSKAQEDLFNNTIGVTSSDFVKVRFNRIPHKVIKTEIKNVIITSKNAVASLLNSFSAVELQFENIYCVGRRTKKLIEQQIGTVQYTAKNAQKLAEFLKDELKTGDEVTFFCGDLRRDELPTALQENGIVLNEIEAYQAILDPVRLDQNIKGVLFYSPSTVLSYLKQNKAGEIAFCIGETTATEARKHFKEVKIAKIPTVESVIELVNLYYVQN
ncbi:MAG: hydroxymethylbilane synthase [Flavobacteriaceae bacterium]|nr:hydroxymethylbilane synthase [Flavobacteriaceae bacterium]